MDENPMENIFQDEHIITYLLILFFHNKKSICYLVDAIFSKALKDT